MRRMKMMKNNKKVRRIKKKKSGFWLLIYMLIGAVIGAGIGGFGIVDGANSLVRFIDSTMNSRAFEIYIIVTMSMFIAGIVCFWLGLKKFRASLVREDDIYDETLLSVAMGLVSISFIFVFILLTPLTKTILNNPYKLMGPIAVAIMFFIVVVGAVLQNKMVQEIKKGYPEKEGDIYDINFKKDWENSMDEREKAIMHEAAYKSYKVTMNLIFIISLLFLLLSLAGSSNNALAIALMAIAATMQVTYIYSCIKLEKK